MSRDSFFKVSVLVFWLFSVIKLVLINEALSTDLRCVLIVVSK